MKTTKTYPKETDIRTEAMSTLQAVQELGGAYGINYLARFLKGYKKYGLKEASHADLPTFGSLEESYFERVHMLIAYLVQEDFLMITDHRYGKVGITEKGEVFLKKPKAFVIAAKRLRMDPYDKLLESELKDVRKNIRETQKTPAYRVYTDYTISVIIQEKPQNVRSLKEIPGISDFKVDRYGHLILAAVNRVRRKKEEDAEQKLFRASNGPTALEVKALFESGLSVEEIAEKRQVKSSTIKNTLIKLHKTGQVNLKPWIEKTIDPHVLLKGTTYFQEAVEKRLKIAYEELGLDYEVLRMCRLYVSNVSTVQKEISL